MPDTSAPVGGTVTSGVFPNNTYPLVNGQPDKEQKKRLQARQEHDWANGDRPDHPSFTKRGPEAPALGPVSVARSAKKVSNEEPEKEDPKKEEPKKEEPKPAPRKAPAKK